MTGVEFSLLLITFLVCLSLVWSSLRSGITPVPSSRKARQEIIAASHSITEGNIIELGSGWGGLAKALARNHPGQMVIGYELSPVPWLIASLTTSILGLKNLAFKRKNFLKTELDEATLLVCYLHPKGMLDLEAKLNGEKPPVQMLISHTFALPNHKPQQVIHLDDLYKSPIYIYQFDNQPQEK